MRGPAGSGKSTLVQWLALNAARQSFGDELTGWNRCVPFVLRLRAFTALDSLPSPADFLRAAGVPLHGSAPAGWADRLMHQGRALVLVDGVDEVPDRLRKRTERWLKDLIVAYPRAKYVVTTRPSAVPETWLSASGFEPHTLLAMRQEDVRAFIGHWHRAARSECRAEEERAELDRYENALRRAVGTRRDLGLLATNPLMCALLCALNRDRRMQLPRARKELYDAALDMLLVRGTPDQVFTHLLNRSGLLREPAPGSVGFVHRTFQDYLGAKAAVEARDFGVLVRHAHEDQWDDVVQMAVGHARPDERAVLLRGLLKPADREPEHGHRLVLLAAGSLAHAPELDPGVREEVEELTGGLLPPESPGSIDELAKVGDLAVELLASMVEELTEREAAAVRTAAEVGSETAYELAKQFREDDRGLVADAVSSAWKGFDTDLYAREVLAARTWEDNHLAVTTDAQLSALRHLPLLRNVHVSGNRPDLTAVTERPDVEQVFVYRNDHLSDVAPLAAMARLREIGLSLCPQVRDIEPLVRPGVEWLSLAELHPALDPSPLARMRDLRYLALCHPFLMESVGELPVCEQVTGLELLWQTRYMNLEGLEGWTGLRELTLHGATHFRQLSRMRPLHGLSELRLLSIPELDLRLLSPFTALRELLLLPDSLASGLEPLTELPFLETLVLYGEGPYDLAPLTATENLTIQLAHNTHATGTHLFPPDRIIRLP
ncbi:NACHT domain-containing protein [Streptomyces bacillaris]